MRGSGRSPDDRHPIHQGQQRGAVWTISINHLHPLATCQLEPESTPTALQVIR